MKDKINQYKIAERLTKGILKYYITDLTHHDKELLKDYQGNWLYAVRESGTDIYLIDRDKTELHERLIKEFNEIRREDDAVKQFEKYAESTATWLTYDRRNIKFFKVFNGKAEEVTAKEINEIIKQDLIKKVWSKTRWEMTVESC